MLVLIPLVLAGGEVLHDFSLALLWGVIFGTYSSVFVASPLLLLWPGSTRTAPEASLGVGLIRASKPEPSRR